jgi:hypothetical protein
MRGIGIASVRTSASFAFALITVAVSAHTFSGFSARGPELLPSFLAGDEEVCSVGRTSLSKSLDSGEYAEAETSGVEAIQRAAPDRNKRYSFIRGRSALRKVVSQEIHRSVYVVQDAK